MILVDTSVWIRFLANREPFASGLDRLLAVGDAVGHEMVFGELLMGDVDGGRSKLLADYALMTQAVPVAHEEVVAFVRARRLHGRGVGWVDVHLLASALTGGLLMWTADPRFAAVAAELGLAYEAAKE
jgi:predicted nucleic acid-binding protein